MKIASDPWLAEIFGYQVCKLVPDPGESDQAQIGTWLSGVSDRAFAYAKVPVDQVRTVGAFTAAGFRVIDVNVTCERPPASRGVEGGGSAIRQAQSADREAVLAVAATCFVYSRFHLDPLVPDTLANQIKRAWVDSYFQGKRGEGLLVAEAGGKPVGFLAVLGTLCEDRPVQVIDLIGVAREHQGQGLGRRLVEYFAGESAGRCVLLRVGTQVANIPSLNLYGRCGFRVAEAAYVLHAHVEEGRILHAHR